MSDQHTNENPIKLYNSRSKALESFRFQTADQPITLYVCGITPYDTTHLGHAFTYTTADILIRYLAYCGKPVNYVQNVTDIDDDILRKAAEVGEDWRALGNQWTRHFIEDMQTLNVRAPDAFPRATETIPQIVAMVEELIEQGFAYVVAGNVYYDVDRWPNFGNLSELPREDLLPTANERGNNPDDPNKRNPLDFVLWQATQPNEPSWASPWGRGRPGWHIECSAMSTHLLGETIDLHMGGADLLFPHHECEIAQVVSLTDKPFVRYWMHVAMVHKDGEKMSKSLGNLVMVRDLLEHFSPNALRLYFAQHYYRAPWSYCEEELREAENLTTDITAAVALASSEHEETTVAVDKAQRAFEEAMSEDLNTPQAMLSIEQLTTALLNANHQRKAVGKGPVILRRLCEVFGLAFPDSTPAAPSHNGVVVGTASWEQHLSRFLS